MNKIIWILACGVTVLMARASTAIQCYKCDSREDKICLRADDPTFALVPVEHCPVETKQCYKWEGKIGYERVVVRYCARPTAGINTCVYGEDEVSRPDGSKVKSKGHACLCSRDLCNDGEKFEPKLKLIMIAMMAALMNIFFN